MPDVQLYLSLVRVSAIPRVGAGDLFGSLWVPVDGFAEVKVAFATALICVVIVLLCWMIARVVTLLVQRARGVGVHVVVGHDEGEEKGDPASPRPRIEPGEDGSDLGGFRCIAGGRNAEGQCDVPANELFVGVASGVCHSIGLRSDGSVLVWGRGWQDEGVAHAPGGERFVQVVAGHGMSAGLRADGSVLAWDIRGQYEIEYGNDITKIAMGWRHVIGLRADGTVAGLAVHGGKQQGLASDIHCRDIAANRHNSLLLRSDGRVIALGPNDKNQCDVPDDERFKQVAMGLEHAIGLREDGTVIGWGSDGFGQCEAPPGVRFDSIDAGILSVGLRGDGRACAWGPRIRQLDGYRFKELSMTGGHVLGLVEDRVGPDDDTPNLRTGRRLPDRSAAMAFAGGWDEEHFEDWRHRTGHPHCLPTRHIGTP